MPNTVQQSKPSGLIAIPAPKFNIGDRVLSAVHGEVTILTWMYVPIDPIPDSGDVPYGNAGFNYITTSNIWGIENLHEEDITLA